AHRAASAIVAARTGLDGDRLCRADRLAQLACDAAFFAVRVAAQRMFTAEARADRPLLVRVVQRRLRREELAHGKEERADEFCEQKRFCGVSKSGHRHSPAIMWLVDQPETG